VAETETQPVTPALMAELTWAKLYTEAMHKDLDVILRLLVRVNRLLLDRK
jgi:hypothetical protein